MTQFFFCANYIEECEIVIKFAVLNLLIVVQVSKNIKNVSKKRIFEKKSVFYISVNCLKINTRRILWQSIRVYATFFLKENG